MTRYFGIALCFCLVVIIGATLVGRAFDHEAQQRIIFSKNGRTLDCERVVRGTDLYYENCVTP